MAAKKHQIDTSARTCTTYATMNAINASTPNTLTNLWLEKKQLRQVAAR